MLHFMRLCQHSSGENIVLYIVFQSTRVKSVAILSENWRGAIKIALEGHLKCEYAIKMMAKLFPLQLL